MKFIGTKMRKFLVSLSVILLCLTVVGFPLAVVIILLETICESLEK